MPAAGHAPAHVVKVAIGCASAHFDAFGLNVHTAGKCNLYFLDQELVHTVMLYLAIRNCSNISVLIDFKI